MKMKMIWGFAAFIILIGAVVVLIVQPDPDPIVKYNDTPISIPKPPDEPGFKWVEHGDHWDKVRISTPSESITHPEKIDPPTQATHSDETYKGPLTYHAELLETNPSKALQELAKEMNHWSADYLPDIPPDDHLATEYARVEYLMTYIRATGEVPPGVDPNRLDEKFDELHREHRHLRYSVNGIINWQDPNNPTSRFTKLTWIGLEPPLRWDDRGMAHWH